MFNPNSLTWILRKNDFMDVGTFLSCYYSKVTRFIMADIFSSSIYTKKSVQGHFIKLAIPVNKAEQTISGM